MSPNQRNNVHDFCINIAIFMFFVICSQPVTKASTVVLPVSKLTSNSDSACRKIHGGICTKSHLQGRTEGCKNDIGRCMDIEKNWVQGPRPKSPIGIWSGIRDYVGPGSSPETFQLHMITLLFPSDIQYVRIVSL